MLNRSFIIFLNRGMPECVASWIKFKDPAKISQIQRELIEVYENDFSKHNGKVNSGRILMVFRSIPSQLAKPNEKFMYGAVREGGRARDFEAAIEWLVSAGILCKASKRHRNHSHRNQKR